MADNYVVGRTEKSGNLQDVRVYVNADGLNRIDIARDKEDLSPRVYVVDRRTLPDGPWRRLLEVESFSDSEPERLSEVRAKVDFEIIPNRFEIETIKTWGLPEGMESPWNKPLEMVGNELLLDEHTMFVSGDAPINTIEGRTFKNGKYEVHVGENRIVIRANGVILGTFETNTASLQWTEGIAGAISFVGGSVYLEPAKPPLLVGSFFPEVAPHRLKDALYQYNDSFLIASQDISDGEFVGAFALVDDPFPERWVNRVFCRAYVDLISPAYKPPLTEEEPKRISIRVEYPENDFPDISPKAVTPYSNETGVFNSWDIPENPVELTSKERPWDILIPMHDGQDWGGYPVENMEEKIPATDFLGARHASFPSLDGYTLPDLPELREGTIFLRWKDSSFFRIIRNDWIDLFYKEGWIYHENKASPDASGIAKIDVHPGWNDLIIYWDDARLIVNNVPGQTEERSWGEVLESERIWGAVANVHPDRWEADPDYPLTIEQFEEKVVDWVTGRPEGEVEPPEFNYDERPRTWGRILYERYGFDYRIPANSQLPMFYIQNLQAREGDLPEGYLDTGGSTAVIREDIGIGEIADKGIGD